MFENFIIKFLGKLLWHCRTSSSPDGSDLSFGHKLESWTTRSLSLRNTRGSLWQPQLSAWRHSADCTADRRFLCRAQCTELKTWTPRDRSSEAQVGGNCEAEFSRRGSYTEIYTQYEIPLSVCSHAGWNSIEIRQRTNEELWAEWFLEFTQAGGFWTVTSKVAQGIQERPQKMPIY